MRFQGRSGYYRIQILLVLSICLISSIAKSQKIIDIQVSGGSPQFVFNTLDNYEDGVDLIPKTTLNLRMRDLGVTNWQLIAYALDETIAYEGAASNDIPLSELELKVNSSEGSVLVSNPFSFPIPAGVGDSIVIAEGNGGPFPVIRNVAVSITYHLNPMLNKPAGLYYVALYFKLRTF